MKLQQRIRRDQARNNDDWLITYADTITLLLCLFVIALSARNVAKIPPHEAPAPTAAVAAPVVAQDGVFWGGATAFKPINGAPTEATVDEPTDPARSLPVPEPPQRDVATAAPRDQQSPAELPQSVPQVTRSAPAEAAPPKPAPSSLPAVVQRLQSQGTPIVAQSGDRITTLQVGSAAFFPSGSAALSSAGKSILSDVAVTLKSSEFAAYHITIEGHTDDTPINTPQFQSNWELSAARAAAVVRFLLDLGVPAGKLTAAGYADTVPVAPNRTPDGTVIPENQARNRRVVIRLERIEKAGQ